MSFVSGRIGRTLAAAAAIVAVAASLTLAPTATAGAEADGPHYQEPTVGQCRNYTMTAAMKETNSTPVIACSQTHTARVYAVTQIPDSLSWDTATFDQLQPVMMKACWPTLEKALGRGQLTNRKSAYSLMWFVPTDTQKQHGARWLRCDVVRLGGNALLPLLKDSSPMLPSTLTNAHLACLTGDKHLVTACSKAHNYRATGGLLISSSTYPGNDALYRIAQRKCPAKVSTPRNWYAFWPSKVSWKYGDRAMVCFSHRSN